MKIPFSYPWDLSSDEAIAVQEELRGSVVLKDRFREIRTVAGLDVAFPSDGTAQAAVAVLAFPGLEVIEEARAERAVTFPYVRPLLLPGDPGPAGGLGEAPASPRPPRLRRPRLAASGSPALWGC